MRIEQGPDGEPLRRPGRGDELRSRQVEPLELHVKPELVPRLLALAAGAPLPRSRSWAIRVWAELSTLRGLFSRAAR